MTFSILFQPRTFVLAIIWNFSFNFAREIIRTIDTNERSGRMFFSHFTPPSPSAGKWPNPYTKKKNSSYSRSAYYFVILTNYRGSYYFSTPSHEISFTIFINTVDKIIKTKLKKTDESITLLERDGRHMVDNEPTTYDNGGNTPFVHIDLSTFKST